MPASKVLLIPIIILFTFECTQAQRHRKVTKSRYDFSAPKVRGQKAKIVCPAFDNSKYPYHGVGFKLGDPFALTYKYYPNKRLSFAADFGKAASGLYRQHFQEQYDLYLPTALSASDESPPLYVSHRAKSDWVAEVKALYHFEGEKIAEGLKGYLGAGWQWRRTNLLYEYQYSQSSSQPQREDPFGAFERMRETMGPQVTMGIEYSYFSLPVAAFLEVEYFTDVKVDPGWYRFEGGVGLRYIF